MLQNKRSIALILIIGILVLIAASGCGPGDSATQEPSQELPFSATSHSEDGAIFTWSGVTTGYEAGKTYSFDIKIQNDTDNQWEGRYCLNLMAPDSHKVVANLKSRDFNLDPGLGYSDTISVSMPSELVSGMYGLSMAVHRPAGPMVDMIPIEVGDAEGTRLPATQEDMNASLAACPPVTSVNDVLEQAMADLAQRLGINVEDINVKSVEATEFADASLGVPEEGVMYAQVITPGYIIELSAEGKYYLYHTSEERVVLVPENQSP